MKDVTEVNVTNCGRREVECRRRRSDSEGDRGEGGGEGTGVRMGVRLGVRVRVRVGGEGEGGEGEGNSGPKYEEDTAANEEAAKIQLYYFV